MPYDPSDDLPPAATLTEDSILRATVRDIPAWGISLFLHAAALLILASVSLSMDRVQRTTISSVLQDIAAEEEFVFDSAIIDKLGSEVDVSRFSPSQAFTGVQAETQQQHFQEQLEQEFLEPKLPIVNEVLNLPKADLQARVELQGDVVHTGGVDGVMDRLTFEIATSLRERKTLVIWLFDVSPSVSKRREQIARRFENVYKQLGILDVGADEALKTAVVSFGEKVNFVTKQPVSDVSDLADAVRKIDTDNSGDEFVFTAAWQALNRWESYRTRLRHNVMLIIVTDEAGSDQQRVDDVIHLAVRQGVRCYCVGNAAPFGRQVVEMPWSTANGETVIGEADQGPETAALERLRLAYWGHPNWDQEELASGFGPYALSRLCAETGGTYFIAEEIRGQQFDSAVLRNYVPRYEPLQQYEAELKQSSAKVALVRVAAASNVDIIPRPRLQFRANDDNVLRQGLTQAQQPIAELDYRLNELLSILRSGEPDRDKLVEPRWRASFDLAMGRLLALHARAYGYNVTLAEMKSLPKKFETKGSNAWRLVPSGEILSGPSVKKLAAQAVGYLTRVVEEHPGTPWQVLAERELSIPLGWEWRETTMPVPDARMRQKTPRPRPQNRPRPQPPAPPKRIKI